jgi:hypothetical protein
MDNLKPIYETNYLGYWIKVYPNRVEFRSGIPGTQSIPINQIASVQLGFMGLMQITLESAGGKKYNIPCFKKKEARDAIYRAQEALNNTSINSGNNTSVADELIKLSQLKEKGVLSEKEFEEQKKKLLS